MNVTLDFIVLGVPAPAGSKRGFVVNGRAVLVNDNKPTQKAWRQAVSAAAHEARGDAETIRQAVRVGIEFVMPRPSSARKADVWKPTKPDIDKLLRSTLDGLTDAAVFADDALVVRLWTVKRLARLEADDPPGARIIVSTDLGDERPAPEQPSLMESV